MNACEQRQQEQDSKTQQQQRREIEDAKRVAEAQKRVAQRTRWGLIGVSALLLIAVIAGATAFKSEQKAKRETEKVNVAREKLQTQNVMLQAREYLAYSEVQRQDNAECSLSYALKAYDVMAEIGRPNMEAENTLRKALIGTKTVEILELQDVQVNDFSISPSGIIAIDSIGNEKVHFWDTNSQKKLETITIQDGVVKIAWNAKVNSLFIASTRGKVLSYNPKKNTDAPKIIFEGNHEIENIDVSPNGKWLAVSYHADEANGLRAKHVAVELGTDNIVELPKVTSTHTLGLKWSPSSDKLSATSNNGIVAIWDLTLNGVLTEVSTGIGEQILWDIAWSPDESFLGVGSEDGKVYVIDTNKAMVTQTFVEHANQVTSIDWASNDILISGSWDSTIRVWNAKLGKQVNKLTGHSSAITSIQWNSKKRSTYF